MENNEKQIREFIKLISTDRSIAESTREETERNLELINDEVSLLEKAILNLDQEQADYKTKLDELEVKAQQIKDKLTASKAEATVQEIKEIYEDLLAVEKESAAVTEGIKYLQRIQKDTEHRLRDMKAKIEPAERQFVDLKLLTGDLQHANGLLEKMGPMVQNHHNFGFKIIKAQEEERRRVSREIHDGPAQAMANVIFLAEICERLIEIDSNRAKDELHELRNQVRGCLDETRKIIFDLRPMVLDDLGLIPTVKRIADILKDRTGGQTNVKVSCNNSKKLESHVEVSLFRIIQESLNNIEKHAAATEVQILIDFQPHYVLATVKDNGKGFEDVKSTNNGESFGLVGMRERISLLNGELKINSNLGRGTEISVKIPIGGNYEEKQLA